MRDNLEIMLCEYRQVMLMGIPVYFPDLPFFDEEGLLHHRAVVYSKMTGLSVSTSITNLKDLSPPAPTEHDDLIFSAQKYCRKSLSVLMIQAQKTQWRNTLKSSIIQSSFFRVYTCLDSCIFLSIDGYNFETKSLLRMALEMMNFAFLACDVEGEGEGLITDYCRKNKIEPTHITKLKNYCDHIRIGKLYNTLSAYAHVDPISHAEMFFPNEGGISIYLKARKFCFINLYLCIILVDLAHILLEYCTKDLKREFIFIDTITYKVRPEYRTSGFGELEQLFKIGLQQTPEAWSQT